MTYLAALPKLLGGVTTAVDKAKGMMPQGFGGRFQYIDPVIQGQQQGSNPIADKLRQGIGLPPYRP